MAAKWSRVDHHFPWHKLWFDYQALQPRWTNWHHDVLGSLKECAFNPHDPFDSPSSASEHYQAKNVLSLPNVDCALFSWRFWPSCSMSSEERPKRPWNMSNMWKWTIFRRTSYYKLRRCIPKVHGSSRVWRSLPICRPTPYLHHLLMVQEIKQDVQKFLARDNTLQFNIKLEFIDNRPRH